MIDLKTAEKLTVTQEAATNVRHQAKYKPKTIYTFDLAPSDTYQYRSAPQRKTGDFDREYEFHKTFQKLIRQLYDRDIDIQVCIEISQPYDGSPKTCSRLHLHGLIRWQNREAQKWFDLYGSTLCFKLGTLKIDTIEHESALNDRIKYCKKQQKSHKWKKIITNPLGFDLFKQCSN